jgi:CheY-like chemotaxis protein
MCILLNLGKIMSVSLKNKILLIDDSSSEPLLLASAIEKSERNIVLECMDDSIVAVSQIQERAERRTEELPNLILLDLNMPGYSGVEVLQIFRKDDRLKYLPILIMTSSSLNEDLKACLEAGANCVIVKPSSHKRYIEVVQMINDFWFKTVKRIDSGYF